MTSRNDHQLVTVILPVYNGAEFVGCTLQSVMSQTYRNLEIVVVDDGSTDNTLAVLDAQAAGDPRVRLIIQDHAGVACARNRAIAEARGEFIAPIDADDLWVPEKIARQMSRLRMAGETAGFVYSWWVWIDGDGAVLDRSPRWRIEGMALEKLICINFCGNASVPLFRRHCLEEVGGYNEKLAAAKAGGCEDWEVVLRIAERYRIAVVPEVLLGYRQRPGTMSAACETMWRSQQMVIQGIRLLRPELKPALFRASANQFAMYLAALCFRLGDSRQALRWGFRAGIRLPLAVSPYLLKLLLFRRRNKDPLVMRPGAKLVSSRIPEPGLPYDQAGNVLRFRAAPDALKCAAARFLHGLLRARANLEAWSSRIFRARKTRILARSDWQFPVYSLTFVYREIHSLVNDGFNVRLTYSLRASRSLLPDDLGSVWNLKRWVLLSKFNSAGDLEHYRRIMPDKVAQLTRVISEASGLDADEIMAHPDFKRAFSFTRFAEAWKPDYIHTYCFYEGTLFGYVASFLLGIPRGVSCYADHMLNDYELKLVGLHLQTCDLVVATSARIKRELEEIAGKPLPAAIVKPNGIDARLFASAERTLPGPDHFLRGVAVNRIDPKKGVTYLAEAVLLLRDRGIYFVVDILGEPDDRDPHSLAYYKHLMKFVTEHNLKALMRFRGRRTAREVRQYLASADIFLAPFVELPNGDKDGIPTALLEAMAAGCAVVTTDAGSILEVIDNGVEGIVVPQCDSMAIAESILQLAKDNALLNRLSRAAILRVRKQFDVSHCEEIFHQRVRRAINSKHTGQAASSL
jgi:glycosyltransferase involved in cell wall biosynthesis